MKIAILLPVAALFLFACNNQSKEPAGNAVVKTKADTLLDAVNEGHNVGMAKMGALTRAEQEAERLIDSLNKLPAKAKAASAPYKERLNGLLGELKNADSSMEKWMGEFRWDSTFATVQEKISYLEPEKEKVDKVKSAILNSLEKADSVLRKKF